MIHTFDKIVILLLLVILLPTCNEKSFKIYSLVKPEDSNIYFSNDITIADSLVLPGYEYIYNGGGVGVIDINNDGLQDLFFSGNMVSSKLYLNKGNLKFEDITEKAGVHTSTWVNGVSIVDINSDGFKDIYLSVGGHQFTPESQRKNILFINSGDNTFKDSAQFYGLDDNGYNMHAAFFDYDRDGDLDAYLLRNSFVDYPRNNARPKSVHGEAYSTDKLMKNNGNNTFTDVSREAGILIEGFGLGINVCDFNRDGWPDIYVANDFVTNDLLWINSKNGTFTNEIKKYLPHQTFNGMGVDVADYNNDGYEDIVELDMLPPDNKRWKLTPRGNSYDEFQNGLTKGYEPQYVRNTLQLNNGNGTFSEIGQLAGIEATDWSWSSLFIDVDHDGWRDLFISNGYGRDITNLDFIVYGDKSQSLGMDEASVRERQKLLKEIPGISVHNYFFRNTQDLRFSDYSDKWTDAVPSFSNGAAYADLDLDGDLDLITNNIDEPAGIWKSNMKDQKIISSNHIRFAFSGESKNKDAFGSKLLIKSNGLSQVNYITPYRGYLSTMEPYAHFGVGASSKIDTVIMTWPDGKQELIKDIPVNQVYTIDYKNAATIEASDTTLLPLFKSLDELNIQYIHSENVFTDFKVQPLLAWMHSKNGPGIAIGDVNGDAIEDFYIGNGAGKQGKLFMQGTDGKFIASGIPFTDSLADEMGVLLLDADSDADLDLYIVHGGSEQRMTSHYYQDVLYINDGKGNFIVSKESLPEIKYSGSVITACDFDKDGDLDLFRGSRLMPAAYPLAPVSYLLVNESKNGRVQYVAKDIPSFKNLGMVTSALWTDFDNDDWTDLIVVGEFMPITFLKNDKGNLIDITSKSGLKNTQGWWNTVSGADLDNDGDVDYIAGNLGLNTRFKASVKEPLCIYAKDYNSDGTIDPVMSSYIQGIKYANHTRDALISQITAMRGRFRTYTAYATASFDQTLTAEELANAYQVTAETFESILIENIGNAQFKIHSLPVQAQFAPVYGIAIDDWDMDGELDAMITGNSYALEVITGRADANSGLILKGDGKLNFQALSNTHTGFSITGDTKGLVKISLNNKASVLVARNTESLVSFGLNTPHKVFHPSVNDRYASVTLANGARRKYEFYKGDTYLSSGSNSIIISSNFKALEVVDNAKSKRNIEISKR